MSETVKSNFEPVEEMLKLRKYLDEHKIEWEDKSDEYICRTWFDFNGYHWSAINGKGTYGGFLFGGDKVNQNLLECWAAPFGEDPAGWLTADDIIAKMEGKDEKDSDTIC